MPLPKTCYQCNGIFDAFFEKKRYEEILNFLKVNLFYRVNSHTKPMGLKNRDSGTLFILSEVVRFYVFKIQSDNS